MAIDHINSIVPWLLLALVLCAFLVCLFCMRRLARKRDELLQEKDAAYNFVHDVSEAFVKSDSTQIDFLLKRVLYYAQQTTKAGAGAIYFMEADGSALRVRAVSGLFPPLVNGVDQGFESAESKFNYVEKLVKEQIARRGQGILWEVVERGSPLLIEDAERDTRVPNFKSDLLKIQSILLVPMRFQNTIIGVLVVVNRVDDMPFVQSDLNLLQGLADQASVTIYFAKFSHELDKKRILDHDLRVAKEIQSALLPKQIPSVEGMELAAFSVSADEVGGDYYDFVTIDNDHLGVMIGDVSGKGVTGAIFMSICRSVFRANAQGCLSPADVLKAINSVISSDIHEDMFISMLYLVLNIKTFEMSIARAGHTKPFIVPSTGEEPIMIESKGIAVGMADSETFNTQLEEIVIPFKPGNIFVAYTDGVFEALNSQQQEWSLSNLKNTVCADATSGAKNIVSHVQQELLEFAGDMAQYDDMTLVVMSRDKERANNS